jgi:uncharacterized SAM-binding protein YcdF (DUF218 family)
VFADLGGSGHRKRSPLPWVLLALVALVVLTWYFSDRWLGGLGAYLVDEATPSRADAAVVLAGPQASARLSEAARLYRAGVVDTVIINGGRQDAALAWLNAQGIVPDCRWHSHPLAALEVMGVPATDVIAVEAPQAYDTMTEARRVGARIIELGLGEIVLTTSHYHTRRAGMTWRRLHGERLRIHTVGASNDGYRPDGWWRDRRQTRWVLAEYGALAYLWWHGTGPD